MDYKLEAESGSYKIEGKDVNFIVEKLTENIQLNDRVSTLEKGKIFDWFQEKNEEFGGSISTIESLIKAIKEGLSGAISNETIEFIVQLLGQL